MEPTGAIRMLEDQLAAARSELAELRGSQERYRALFDSVDEGFCVIEVLFDADKHPVDYRFLECNRAFLLQTGLHDAVGRSMRSLAPDHEQHWFDIYGRIALTGRPERFEDKADALGRWYDVYAFRIDSPAEHHVAILFRDVQDRKRADEVLRDSEEQQVFLLKLADALRPLADHADIQDVAAALLGEQLDADRAYYAWVEGDHDSVIIEREYASDGVPSVVGRHRFADFASTFEAYSAGRNMVIADVEAPGAVPEQDLPAYRALRVRALISVPLVKQDRTVASMTILSGKPVDWSGRDVALVEETAERTWAAVERARVEAALRESEALRGVALAGGRMGTWRWNLADRLIWGDAQFLTLWGFPPSDEPYPLSAFTERMSPKGAAEMEEIVTKAIAADEEFDGPLEITSGPTAGSWIRWRGRAAPGDTSTLYGVTFEITDQVRTEARLRESEDRLRLLVAELQHRVRNILTVVRSIFSRTAAAGGEPQELANHFQGRLDALARTQVIVTQSASGTVDLENMIRDELISVGVSDGPHVGIEGPDVMLPSNIAESLGLAIHELTTNALKYGALKVPAGRIDIAWTTNPVNGGPRRLLLTWAEQGVPAVPLNPARQGVGTELIAEALPYRLGADTKLEFLSGGVRCSISVPLPG